MNKPIGYETLSNAINKKREEYDKSQQKYMIAMGKATENTSWRRVWLGNGANGRYMMIPDYVPNPPVYDTGYNKAVSEQRYAEQEVSSVTITSWIIFFVCVFLALCCVPIIFSTDINVDNLSGVAGFFFFLILPFILVPIVWSVSKSNFFKQEKKIRPKMRDAWDDWYDKYSLSAYPAYD